MKQIFVMALLCLFSSYGVNAQCTDFSLSFGTPTQVGNLVAVPVIMNASVSNYEIIGMNIGVQVSPAAGVVLNETAIESSIDNNIGNSGFIDFDFSVSNIQVNLTGLSQTSVVNIQLGNTVVTLFTLVFSGTPGACYDLTFTNDMLAIPPYTIPFTRCNATNAPQAQVCVEGETIYGNARKVDAPGCVNTFNLGIQNVTVAIADANSLQTPICMGPTDAYGDYEECIVAPLGDYRVTAIKDENHSCGVDEIDLTLISTHITGQTPLTTLYEYIAADVNQSGHISTFDVIEARKFALGTPGVGIPSWKFIPTITYFELQSQPKSTWLAYDPDILLEDFVDDFPYVGSDFYGIKAGDLDDNCTDCGNFHDSSDPAENRSVTTGSELGAYWAIEQVEDNWWKVALNTAGPGQFLYAYFKIRLKDDKSTLSYESQPGAKVNHLYQLTPNQLKVDVMSNDLLPMLFEENFTLVEFTVTGDFESRQDLKNQLDLYGLETAPRIMTGEGLNYQWLNLMKPEQNNVTPVFSLSPNPFAHSLYYEFSNKQTAETETILRFYDNTGKLLEIVDVSSHKSGVLSLNHLPSGLIIYNLQQGGLITSGKLIHH